MKSKKAMIFNIALVLLALTVLTTAFFRLSNKQFDKTAGLDVQIGERQAQIFNLYQQAEKALFYIDQSAKLSAYQSVYDLGQKGGFENQSDCGIYHNYNFWKDETGECLPENIKSNFTAIFNENLDDYASLYSGASIPFDNYDLELKNNLEILGKAKSQLQIGVSGEKSTITEYNAIIERASRKYDIPSALIKAIIKQESNFKPKAISMGCGAAGLMQLMPGTAQDLGLKTYKNAKFTKCNDAYSKELAKKIASLSVEEAAKIDERFDPEKNIMAGVKHFASQYKKYNYDIELSTAAYNWGGGNVNKYCNLNEGFHTCTNLPKETEGYVEKVKKYYDEYVYDEIQEELLDLNEICAEENNLTECLEDNFDKSWSYEPFVENETKCSPDRRIARINVTEDKEILTGNGFQNNTIKFAYYFDDEAPPGIARGVEINKVNNKNILTWKENPEEDVDYYEIYYNNKTFNDIIGLEKPIKKIKKPYLKELPEEGYYAVIAVDCNDNRIYEGITSKST